MKEENLMENMGQTQKEQGNKGYEEAVQLQLSLTMSPVQCSQCLNSASQDWAMMQAWEIIMDFGKRLCTESKNEPRG